MSPNRRRKTCLEDRQDQCRPRRRTPRSRRRAEMEAGRSMGMNECGHPVNTMNEHIRNLQERLQAKEEESTLLAASLRKAERERDQALAQVDFYSSALKLVACGEVKVTIDPEDGTVLC